ncbi:MAG: patatin-like phospholipase family protein [Bacilli bacterium]|nr:patatin-like phospholipase family protein [Bacilli bacterium]
MKKAIVLSGGGAHGSYQIGVWKALRELKYQYNIVTGTSVGALNGILMVENDFDKALYLWENLNFGMVFKDPIGDINTDEGKKNILKTYTKNVLFHGGMDVSRLEETVARVIDVKKFYASLIDYGLITVKFSNLASITLTKKEIEPIDLKDFVIASATCFPFFKKKKIKNDLYIDGGYHDNLPINLALEMGAEEIIAVDLNTIGIKQRIKTDNVKITYISPRNKLGSFLVFDHLVAARNIKYGYNDTMKVFKRLDGDKFTFKRNHLKRNFDKYFYKLVQKTEDILENNKTAEKILLISNYKYLLNYDLVKSFKIVNEIIEYTGDVFEIDNTNIYNINKFNNLLLDKIGDINVNHYDIEQNLNDNKINIFDKKTIIKYIYFEINNKTGKKQLLNLALLFQREFIAAIYISVLQKKEKNFWNIFKMFSKNGIIDANR